MKKLFVLLMITLGVVTAVSAQDWQYDAETDFHFNCTLINALVEEYGEESIMMRDDDFFLSLSDLLATLYSICFSEEDRVITLGESSEPADDDEASAAVEAEEATAARPSSESAEAREVTAILENRQMHSLHDVDCSVMVADRFDEDFNVMITGERQSAAAVDVFLPGETEPLELEHVHRYSVNVMGSDVPTRTEWAVRDSFPMGLYTFDVHVDDKSYRFQWERQDEAYNTVVLTCLGAEEEATEGEAAADDQDAAESAAAAESSAADAAVEVIQLENDKIHTIEPEGCVVAVDTRFDEDFNVSITGNNQEDLAVDVYLPGESEPLVMDDEHRYTVNIGGPIPVRTEWAVGDDFPMGRYTFLVCINDNSYRFQWNREDAAYRTFVLTCYRQGLEDLPSGVLGDGETAPIPGGNCLARTEVWDEDLNIIIIGEDQDGMKVEVYLPGEIQAELVDGTSSNEFDDGMPYRIEWIDGRYFPLGLYNFEVTIGDESHQLKWQREDEEYNTFVLECGWQEEE